VLPDDPDAAPSGLADTEAPGLKRNVSFSNPSDGSEPPHEDGGVRDASGRPRASGATSQATKIGRYAILEVLGEGGMGTVYAVYDDKLDRRVALKLVRGVSSGTTRKRMLREAQAMAKLSHPNVVPVFEVGEHRGELFIAMEFVQGKTLRDWRDESPRTWREILSTYIQAGEGLAAAHEQELVHRDFKPDNAVVGEDGRVRVLDFGLAAKTSNDTTIAEHRGLPTPVEDGLDTPLTQSGAVLGTPAYMAAEQFLGEPVDHRTDQFSYCVALWEALFGARPFAGANRIAILEAVHNGTVTPPAPSDVPTAIQTLLERGLKVDPNERWPDLPSLLRALRRRNVDPTRRRRGIAAGVGALALVCGSVWGLKAYEDWSRARRVAACEEAGESIAEVWSDETREALRAGLVGTGVNSAELIAGKVMPWLDAQASAWRETRTQACLDTDVRKTWSADTYDRALWCLDERRMELDALVVELTRADPAVVHKAVGAASKLSQLDPCRDVTMLGRLPPPPTEDRERIRGVRAQLSRVGALERAGKYDDGLAAAQTTTRDAQALGWPPLMAAAEFSRGELLVRTGDYPEAERVLEDAFFQAQLAGATGVAASASSMLVYAVGYRQARRADGVRWSRQAEVLLADLGDDGQSLRSGARMNHLALTHSAGGAYADAKALHERALAIQEQALGSEHPRVAASINNLAIVHYTTGEYDAARKLYKRALAIWEASSGPEHPLVASCLNNLGGLHFDTGAFAEAKALHRRAIAIREKALGMEHPSVAGSLVNLANAQSATGADAEAAKLYERAIAIMEKSLGPEHPQLAITVLNLATVHRKTGAFAEAKALYERSLAILEKAQGPEHPNVAAALNNLAGIHWDLGTLSEAKPLYERALAIQEKTVGPKHPDFANALYNLALLHTATGEYVDARPIHERALAIREAALDPEHPNLTLSLLGVAGVALATDRPADAVAPVERALAMLVKANAGPAALAEARFMLARALWNPTERVDADRARAAALAIEARDVYREGGEAQAKELGDVEQWLRTHKVAP